MRNSFFFQGEQLVVFQNRISFRGETIAQLATVQKSVLFVGSQFSFWKNCLCKTAIYFDGLVFFTFICISDQLFFFFLKKRSRPHILYLDWNGMRFVVAKWEHIAPSWISGKSIY